MKRKRWLNILLVLILAFAMVTPADALQSPETDDLMYAEAHTEGDVVPVNVDAYTPVHPERLDPTNVYGEFDAKIVSPETGELNANDYFFGLASREWTAYTFEESFCNVDGEPDIEFSEVTWGTTWHSEGARVYLIDAQIINGDGDIVPYSNDDYEGDAVENSYYAGLIANKVAIGGVFESVKQIIRNYYLPSGITREFNPNTYLEVGDFGITEFYLPDEVVSADGILLVDITADSVPIDGKTEPTMSTFIY